MVFPQICANWAVSASPARFRTLCAATAGAGLLLSAPPARGEEQPGTTHDRPELPRLVIGAHECAECHSKEEMVWKMSTHFRSNDMHRDARSRERAYEIASKMGIYTRDIPVHARCAGCHATVQEDRHGVSRALGGVSCESCHGGGLKYVDIHGEKKEIPNRAARQELSIEAGMHYPHQIHTLAATCFACHIVQEEDLVNIGGHPARSAGFELLSWSQGEVRHNFYDDRMERNLNINHEASPARRRTIYVTGLLLDLEHSLRALAKGEQRGNQYPYRQAMGKRAHAIIHTELPALVAACGGLEQCPLPLAEIYRIAVETDLTGSSDEVRRSADAIGQRIAVIGGAGSSDLPAAIDGLIPGDARGEPYAP